jgi:hypothetical protein
LFSEGCLRAKQFMPEEGLAIRKARIKTNGVFGGWKRIEGHEAR